MDFQTVALRVASISVEAARKKGRKRKPLRQPLRDRGYVGRGILDPLTEYSCHVELSLSADFEGSVSQKLLMKKFRSELGAAIRAAASITAKDLRLDPPTVKVQPIRFECATNDQVALEESDELE